MQWVRLSFFFSYLQRLSNVYTIEETRRGYTYKMAIQFYHYPKCTTCKKASKWLKDEGIDFTAYDITTDTPTKDELRKFYELSGLPLKKFFNTSGMKYRELGLKDKLADMSEDEQLALLASDGMLIKRPLTTDGKKVTLGFKEQEFVEAYK